MDEYRLQDIWKKNLREFNDVMRLESIIIKAMQEAIKEAQTEQLILSDVSQQREQLIALLKYYENKPLTIGLEEPEFLVDKFLAINCG